MKKTKLSKRAHGFTLIETVIYLGLFAVLIGGSIVAAFSIFESSGRSSTEAMMGEEGNFILGKVMWALSGAQAVTLPAITSGACSATSTTLIVSKWDPSLGVVSVSQSGADALLSKGNNGTLFVLNNSNVMVENLGFVRCYAGGTNPESIQTTLVLSARAPNGMLVRRTFTDTNYLRR